MSVGFNPNSTAQRMAFRGNDENRGSFLGTAAKIGAGAGAGALVAKYLIKPSGALSIAEDKVTLEGLKELKDLKGAEKRTAGKAIKLFEKAASATGEAATKLTEKAVKFVKEGTKPIGKFAVIGGAVVAGLMILGRLFGGRKEEAAAAASTREIMS